jgi:hypothetical protein
MTLWWGVKQSHKETYSYQGQKTLLARQWGSANVNHIDDIGNPEGLNSRFRQGPLSITALQAVNKNEDDVVNQSEPEKDK